MANSFSSSTHCSLDSPSWTELILNHTFLAGVQLEQYLKSLLFMGKTPMDIRSAFLHEATHHWCFLSPVGKVIANLELRARKRAFLHFRDRTDEVEEAILEDVARSMVARDIMRPLAEGLALFAQYDSTPSVFPSFSKITSFPMKWLPMFFADASRLNTGEVTLHPQYPQLRIPGESIYKTLVEMRISAKMVDDKAGLLSRPFSCKDGGYLPGYLLVKSLWRYARTKSRFFLDTDFFLCYLRSFFYDDLGFVAVLLDPQTQGFEEATNIASYFEQRIVQFLKRDLHADAERFESEVLSWEKLPVAPSGARSHDWFHFFSDPYAVQLGYERMQALLENESKPADAAWNSTTVWKPLIEKALLRRCFMHIGSLKGKISIRQKHTQQWQGNLAEFDDYRTLVFFYNNLPVIKLPLLSNEAEMKIPLWSILADSSHQLLDKSKRGFLRLCIPDTFEPSETEGDLDLFFSWDHMYRVGVISLAKKPFAYMFFDLDDNKDAQDMFIALHTHKVEEEALLDSTLLDAVIHESGMEVVLNALREDTQEILNQIYLSPALLYTPQVRLAQCIQLMSENGMYKILKEDRALLEALALLGICTSLSFERRRVSEWFNSFDANMEETIDILCECAKQYGILEIAQTKDLVACFI